jgi:bacteriocin-like protein
MSDQEKKQETTISPQPDAENKKQSAELSEEELKKVTGGTPTATTKPQTQSLPTETISLNFSQMKVTYTD